MSIITCPKCKAPLHQNERLLRCENGHSFDLAKEGYINLLLANQKKTSNPGDNKLMINAREAFLTSGHYDFLIQGIESAIDTLNFFSPTQEIHLLDLGCGSGYYTRNLFKQHKTNKVGIDISKVAVAKAAKKDKVSTYLVGSNFDLTIADHSIDVLVNIFSPISLEELARVVKPAGLFVKVIPIGNHMKEIAELVYENFVPHQSSIEADIQSNPAFQILKTEHLERSILLSGEDLQNFISMTPYLYKFKEVQLEALKELSVTLSFKLIIAKNS